MKNKTWPFVTAMLICALTATGCTSDTAENIVSVVKKQNCFICGDWSGTIMETFGKNDSIGLVYFNQPMIYDTEVRAYDDDGNELFHQETVSVYSANFGEGNGHASMTCMYDRGITDITIYFKESDAVDLEQASEILCQDCLNEVVEFSTLQKKYGKNTNAGTTGFCLVDFKTRKLYSLSEPYHRQSIRDYYAVFSAQENGD